MGGGGHVAWHSPSKLHEAMQTAPDDEAEDADDDVLPPPTPPAPPAAPMPPVLLVVLVEVLPPKPPPVELTIEPPAPASPPCPPAPTGSAVSLPPLEKTSRPERVPQVAAATTRNGGASNLQGRTTRILCEIGAVEHGLRRARVGQSNTRAPSS